MPKVRGAEQGDVSGPLECSLALRVVVSETPLHEVEQQAAGTLPWVGTHDEADVERLQKSSSEQMIRGMLCKKTEA